MPYISFKTNHKLTLRQENTIKSKSGELISLIPGKTEKALMIHMEDDQIMYFKGEETPCMMIEINLYKSAEFDDKKNRQIYSDDVAMFCYPDEYQLGIHPMEYGDIIEIDNLSELVAIDSSYKKYMDGSDKY